MVSENYTSEHPQQVQLQEMKLFTDCSEVSVSKIQKISITMNLRL